MLSVTLPRRVRTAAAACAALTAGAVLAGCGVPPELRPDPGSSVPRPPTSFSARPAYEVPTIPPLFPDETSDPSALPSFPEEDAIPCGGHPTADQVIAMVRRIGGLLPATGTVTVLKGPLCAGSWQYTIFSVPQREPLQVVSRGKPSDLAMVTAGTDICSIEVRTSGPPGIINAALCPPVGS